MMKKMMNKANKELEMIELNELDMENVVGGAATKEESEEDFKHTMMCLIPIYGIYWAFTHKRPTKSQR